MKEKAVRGSYRTKPVKPYSLRPKTTIFPADAFGEAWDALPESGEERLAAIRKMRENKTE